MSTPQRTFGGRYAVIERIGSGGMAEVYRARDELLGREVAVKVLSDRFARDRAFVERFRREAQLAANLNHPNIVSLYDFGTEGDTSFIVMELIEGRSLSDIIRAEGPLLPERAAEIAADVAKALNRAHEAGLVHRDIKPSNIMITTTGQTKVTDFGIARALASDGEQTMTQTGMVIGTASYLSPEQAQGSPLDQRSDIYSLGCVLFEMLTGRAPFTGDSPLAIAYKHVREEPPRPSSVNGDVPSSLDAIALKAMAKDPDTRYSTARELESDIGRYLSGQKVVASSTMVVPATGTQVMTAQEDEEESRRGAWWYALIALGVLALIALGAYLMATNFFGGPQVEVPKVVGLEEAEAREKLARAGFEIEREEKNSKKPEGEVIEQDPEAKAEADEGSTVTIVISLGRKQVEIPDVSGRSLKEAIEILEDEGLKIGEELTEPSDEFDEDQVIRTDPVAGTEVTTGDSVDIYVSEGAEPTSVPNVIGLSEGDAIAAIEGAGFVAESTSAPNVEEEGTVFAQDPPAFSEAEEGDTVRITVSEGPEERAMPDMIGRDGDDAEAELESEYGLNVTQEEVACASPEPPGTVCDQDPAPGEPVAEGDEATLFIQAGDASLGYPMALSGMRLPA